MEGRGELVSRLIVRITRVTTWAIIRVINLLTKSLDPPSRECAQVRHKVQKVLRGATREYGQRIFKVQRSL